MSKIWESRLAMAKAGWQSSISVQFLRASDKWKVSVLFRRDDWHGRVSDEVRVGRSLVLEALVPGQAETTICHMLEDARRDAQRAWDEFPNSLPYQMPDNSFVVNDRGTAYTFGSDGYRQDERGSPTEDLPGDPSTLCDGNVGFLGLTLPLVALGRMFIDVEHSLTPNHFNQGIVAKHRRWGVCVSTTPRRWHGVDLAGYPNTFRMTELHESAVMHALTNSVSTFQNMQYIFRPGAENAIPPGYLTLQQRFLRDEQDLRRRHIADYSTGLDVTDDTLEELRETWEARRQGSTILKEILPEVSMDDVHKEIEEYDPGLLNAPSNRRWN